MRRATWALSPIADPALTANTAPYCAVRSSGGPPHDGLQFLSGHLYHLVLFWRATTRFVAPPAAAARRRARDGDLRRARVVRIGKHCGTDVRK